jgi:hypothetical protein
MLYKHVLGDKDTFGFAFALAGKLHELYFVATPPGAAFKDEVWSRAPAWRLYAGYLLQGVSKAFKGLQQPLFANQLVRPARPVQAGTALQCCWCMHALRVPCRVCASRTAS